MSLHIFTTRWQPATRYRVPGLDHLFTSTPHALVRAHCCNRPRRARNVELQVYYDLTRARCVTGKGCRT